MQVRLTEERSMKIIVHLFETGLLTDENNIDPVKVNDVLYKQYNVKLVILRQGNTTVEALQGMERDIVKLLYAING